jgi:hypothetical protein
MLCCRDHCFEPLTNRSNTTAAVAGMMIPDDTVSAAGSVREDGTEGGLPGAARGISSAAPLAAFDAGFASMERDVFAEANSR